MKLNLIHHIENHPAIALLVGGTHIALAEVLKTAEIPTIVMQGFQVGAWTVTITVGLISLYGTFKRKK